MPKIKPFKGIRYNPDIIDLDKTICPPYDAIGPQKVDDYYNLSPYNAVRLVLGKQLPKDSKENNRYTRARDFFQQWLDQGILIEDNAPCLYYHEHTYSIDDTPFTRKGIIASVRLDEGERKNIRPHEQTQKGPKLDRLRLMNEVRTNFSSIFGIYSDSNRFIENEIRPNLKESAAEFEAENETHRIWLIDDEEMIEQTAKMFLHKKILIADGHHRYETAKSYRDRMRAATGKKDGNQSFDYIQIYLSNKDEGVQILPTHRVILDSMGVGLVDLEYRIKEIFNMIPFDNKKTFLSSLKNGGRGSIGLFVKGIPRYYLLEISKNPDLDKYISANIHPLLKKMDATILHDCVLDPILSISPSQDANRVLYTYSAEEALDLVTKEEADIAFLLNPSSIEEIMEIAETGLRMPRKSTYFFPKTPAGLVFHSLV